MFTAICGLAALLCVIAGMLDNEIGVLNHFSLKKILLSKFTLRLLFPKKEAETYIHVYYI
jgi:hypothetical protein